MNRKSLDSIRFWMGDINLLLIVYLSILMAETTRRVCAGLGAKDFFLRLTVLPEAPAVLLGRTALLTVCLFLLLGERKQEGLPTGWLALRAAAELAICLWITAALQWNYGGLLLLAAVDIQNRSARKRFNFLGLVVAFLLFILLDIAPIPSISVELYLSCYTTSVRSVMLILYRLLASLNTLLFMMYIILEAGLSLAENEQIRRLNLQLNDANEVLKAANVRLEEYAHESEYMAKTQERNRLAREIHDTLGHALTGIITGIDAAIALLDYSTEGAKKQLELVAGVARQGMTDVRRSVKALRPDALEKKGLPEALQQVILQMQATAGIQVTFENRADSLHFDSDEEEVVYRIVQEGLTNAVRHGHASQVWIDISRENAILRLEIRDNGCGCADIADGFGLTHMKERVLLLGGTVAFDGRDGFSIDARIPIRWGETYD